MIRIIVLSLLLLLLLPSEPVEARRYGCWFGGMFGCPRYYYRHKKRYKTHHYRRAAPEQEKIILEPIR